MEGVSMEALFLRIPPVWLEKRVRVKRWPTRAIRWEMKYREWYQGIEGKKLKELLGKKLKDSLDAISKEFEVISSIIWRSLNDLGEKGRIACWTNAVSKGRQDCGGSWQENGLNWESLNHSWCHGKPRKSPNYKYYLMPLPPQSHSSCINWI